jgi:hypothetical protein
MSSINKQFGKDLIINSTTDATGTSVGSVVSLGGANINKKVFLGSSYSAPQLGNSTGAFLTINSNQTLLDTTSTSTNNTAFWGNFIGTSTISTTNSAVTFGTGATLYIDGPPVAGTNVTLTNPWSIYLNTGGSFFGGNVSINTTSVTQALSVNGNINFTGNLYQNGTVYSGTTQWGSTGANIYFNTGNVGISTTAPGTTLDVVGTARFSTSVSAATLNVSTGVTTTSILVTNGGLRATFNSNTVGAIITTGGNVGIGTTSPGRMLSLFGPNANITLGPHLWINTSDQTNPCFSMTNWAGDNISMNFDMYYDGQFRNSNSTTAFQIYKISNQLKFLYQNGTAGSSNGQITAMVVGSAGNIGIGTASPMGSLSIITPTAQQNQSGWNNSWVTIGPGTSSTGSASGNVGIGYATSNDSGSTAYSGGNLICIAPGTSWIDMNYKANSHKFQVNNFTSPTFMVASNGQVCVNTTSPSSTLTVNGSVSKTSGSFDIQHPTQPDKRLVHSFIEGPRCDLIYRGTVKLINGTAVVNLDTDCVAENDCAMTQGTFEALCANPVYYLQNHNSFDRVRANISSNILTITCENTNSTDNIHWMVVAERKDPHIYEWNRTNSKGCLVTEYIPK